MSYPPAPPHLAGTGPMAALRHRDNASWADDLQADAPRWLPTADFNGQLPLQSDDEVVFVLEGNADAPVAVAGSFNGWSTTTHFLEPGAGLRTLRLRWPAGWPRHEPHQYKFYSEGVWFRDPHNRVVVWDGYDRHAVGDFNSVLPSRDGRLPDVPLVWLKAFQSRILGDTRDVFVQLPPHHDDRVRYPVVYVNDGNESITRARYHHRADHAMRTGECAPVILVYVALPTQMVRNFQYVGHDGWPRYATFLAEELVPFIDGNFNTRPTPEARATLGASLGGACAWYAAFMHPRIFGKAAAQSGSFFVNGMDLMRIVSDRELPRLKLYLDSSRPNRYGGGDMVRLAGAMEEALRHSHHEWWHHQTRGDRHDWEYWASRLPAALRYFFPPP